MRSVLVVVALAGCCASDLSAPAEPRRTRPSWQAKLATYSIASVARRQGRRDWNEVTQGNKIVLPYEVYDYLTSRGVAVDKFQLLNPERRGGLRLFTGPLDFCAASGECYLPSWVMKQLGIKEGELCAVATANFPKPELIRLQPYTSDFLDIGDHNEVLTRTIENLGGLTEGSYIRVSDGQRTYTLDVLEVRGKAMPPGQRDDSNGRAVAIGLLECPIDFAEPKDIAAKAKKTAKPQAEAEAAAAAEDGEASGSEDQAEGGAAQEMGGSDAPADRTPPSKLVRSPSLSSRRAARAGGSSVEPVAAEGAAAAAPVPKFKRRRAAAEAGEVMPDSPFSGRARSLAGLANAEEDGDGTADSDADASNERLPRRRRRARAAAEEEEERAVVDGEGDDAGGAVSAPPGAVLLLAKVVELLKALLRRALVLLRGMLTPGDVSFD